MSLAAGRESVSVAAPAVRGRDRRARALDALGVGIAITGLLTAVLGIGERRWRQLAGIGLFLLGVALYAGCGPLARASGRSPTGTGPMALGSGSGKQTSSRLGSGSG